MRKTLLAVAALMAASSVAATANASGTDFNGASGNFGASDITSAFSDTYDFNTGSGLFDISLSTASSAIDFTTLTFDGTPLEFAGSMFGNQYYGLGPVAVSAGEQALTIDGSFTPTAAYSSGSYDGTVEFTAVSAAPEPSTWALMIAGVAMIGAMLRYGRRGGLAVRAT